MHILVTFFVVYSFKKNYVQLATIKATTGTA